MGQPEGPSATSDLEARVRLAMISGIGPRTQKTLLERFGTPSAVLEAPPSVLQQVPGVGPKLSRAIAESGQIAVAEVLAQCDRHHIKIIVDGGDDYPKPLSQIPDPPGVFFQRGGLLPQDALAIAIVGTRHATAYGKRQAHKLASGLARAGMTIVSGLARGIDAAAHIGALEAQGRTIAVLGGGVINIFPPEHKALAERIVAEGGAVISESPPEAPPLGGNFPQRNRIISGLSLGVIVVEAAERSGALITAQHAMEQGRDVFAVPGSVENRTSRGCHRLIRDGAKLVETTEDVLEELGPLFEAAPREDGGETRRPAELLLNELEQQVLDAIGTDPTAVDTVIAATSLPPARVLSTISVLEMRHLVRRLSGTSVARI